MHCNECQFSCKKKGDWNRHLKTKKHLKIPTEIQELKKLVMDQQEQLRIIQESPKIHVTQKFNLTIFLQNQCQHAMNWDDFIHTLQLNPDEIAKSICDGLEELGVCKRPIHCTDFKRKKMCIKNDNTWEHDEDKVRHKLIETTTKYIKEWEHHHPKWYDDENETNTYTKLMTTDLDVITKAVVLSKK